MATLVSLAIQVHHSDNGRQIAGTSALCTTTRSTLGTIIVTFKPSCPDIVIENPFVYYC